MTRLTWFLVIAAGCEFNVDGSNPGDPSTGSGTTGPGSTAAGDDDDDGGGGGGSCDGVYDGTYNGADHGTFSARLVESEARVYVAGISSSLLDGILDISSDDSVYGENNGYWMDGTLNRGTCSLSGTWGVVDLPNVDAGAWATTP